MAHSLKHISRYSVEQRLLSYLLVLFALMSMQVFLVFLLLSPLKFPLVWSRTEMALMPFLSQLNIGLSTFILAACMVVFMTSCGALLYLKRCIRGDLIDPILISSKAFNIYAQLVNLNRSAKRQHKVNILFNQLEVHNNNLKSDELAELSAITISLIEAQEKSDINIRQKAAALQKAQDTQNQFLANMSHEIRTPLNGVIGLSASLLQESMSDTQCEKVETIKQSSEHLLKILNTLFDVAQGNEDKLMLESYEFDLHRTIKDVIHLLASEARLKNIQLKSKVSDLVPRHVKGDGQRLSQVLIQLVENAIKFTQLGSVELLVSLEKGFASINNISGQGLQIKFTVIDTGMGITESKQKQLFKAFTQDDFSNTRKYGGLGLGLTVSRQIVDLMGGSIAIDSNYGQGSEFSFSVPFDVVENSTAVNEASVGIDSGLAVKVPLNILVAEDDEVNQTVVELLFEEMGYQIDIVENGEKACYAVKDKNYDLIFMDLHMPKMDGLEATQHILEFSRDGTIGCQPVIIALTASIMEQTRKECFHVGMKDFMNKPIDAYVLQSIVKKWSSPLNIEVGTDVKKPVVSNLTSVLH